MNTHTTHRTRRVKTLLIAAVLALTVAVAALGAAGLTTSTGAVNRPVTAGRTVPVVAAADWRHRTMERRHLAGAAPRTVAQTTPTPEPLLSGDFAASSCA